MLKTISAALLAVSVIAAPAFAETNTKAATKSNEAPATRAEQTQAPAAKTAEQAKAPVTKGDQAKSKALDANAKMDRHHRKHVTSPAKRGETK
jgi:hypothetical protein